jgi:hypothetical protein
MSCLPGWKAFLSIVLSSAIGALGAMHVHLKVADDPTRTIAKKMGVIREIMPPPKPAAWMDLLCPSCEELWHVELYEDMPFEPVYRLMPGQTMPTLLRHLHQCEGVIRGPIEA